MICHSCLQKKVAQFIKTCVIKKETVDGKTKYKVYNKKETRSFGSYNTMEEAEKRLKQIQWFGRISK